VHAKPAPAKASPTDSSSGFVLSSSVFSGVSCLERRTPLQAQLFNRLGEPLGSLITPFQRQILDPRLCCSCRYVQWLCAYCTQIHTPTTSLATCGVAILVPPSTKYVDILPRPHEEYIPGPGAKASAPGPRFDQKARLSVLSDAATVK
jgi:hypothetical protein